MQTPLLGVILALMGPAALQGPGIGPADLAGDWVLTLDLYGETNEQRITVETTGDRITVAAWGLKLEGGFRDGRLELKRSGKDGPPVTMSGTAERDGMAGDFSIGDLKGKWKATRIPIRPPSAPREHVFEPKEFHRVFSGAIPPVLHIHPGDTVKTWSVDAGGWTPKGVRRSLGGNPLTGPFYVEGALPGDALVV